MPDQDETTVVFIGQAVGAPAGIYTATVTTGDTVTLDDFTDIMNWYAVNLADNTEAVATQGTNVLTVTTIGLATQKILIFAQGT